MIRCPDCSSWLRFFGIQHKETTWLRYDVCDTHRRFFVGGQLHNRPFYGEASTVGISGSEVKWQRDWFSSGSIPPLRWDVAEAGE